MKSRATLIVAPPALTDQWLSEIQRHTTGLKVCFYTGVKGISKTHGKFLLLNPHFLADHDIILTTFGTLQDDLGHSDANPYSAASGENATRNGKRKVRDYLVMASIATSLLLTPQPLVARLISSATVSSPAPSPA